MRRRALTAVLSAVAAALPLASIAAASAANAVPATNVGWHICLSNHRRACLDVKNDRYVLNQTVLVHGGSGANALGWNKAKNPYNDGGVCAGQQRCRAETNTWWPFKSHALDKKYYKHATYLFPPNVNTSLALGEKNGTAELVEQFIGHGDENLATIWVQAGNEFINAQCTNRSGKVCLLTASGLKNGSSVVVQPAGKSAAFTNWYITGFVK